MKFILYYFIWKVLFSYIFVFVLKNFICKELICSKKILTHWNYNFNFLMVTSCVFLCVCALDMTTYLPLSMSIFIFFFFFLFSACVSTLLRDHSCHICLSGRYAMLEIKQGNNTCYARAFAPILILYYFSVIWVIAVIYFIIFKVINFLLVLK